MGTGPRGGKRVREAAVAAAGPVTDGWGAFTEPPQPAAASTDIISERALQKPKGDPAPPPKPGGGTAVDPEDVDKKSSLVLTKKGFAAAAVARACAEVSPTPDDVSQSFNEQKRRRALALTEWLLQYAELWELPLEALQLAKQKRGIADDDNDDDGEHKEQGVVDDVQSNQTLTERARFLVKQGILPIAEKHVRIGNTRNAGTQDNGTHTQSQAGTHAQDRERTGKSLRAVKAEKAALRAIDLCPKVALGKDCAFARVEGSPEHEGSQAGLGNCGTCVYSHDLGLFMRNKPIDLPGGCPFLTRRDLTVCPYGVRCRFFGTHGSFQTEKGEKKETGSSKKSEHAEMNHLADQTQRALARNELALPRAEQVLGAMDLAVLCVSKTQADKMYGDARRKEKQGSLGTSEPFCHANRPGLLPPAPDFRGKLYVAPLTTVGNMPFRRACIRHGADITVSEMAMASNLLKGDRKEWALVRRHPSEKIFGVQVCGGYPDLMARCGELLDTQVQCDFVDINMGCPIDGVCAKGAGASLFKDEVGLKRCELTVRATSRAMKKTPLTIKIRMGYEDDPTKYVAHEVLAKARGWGAAAATLHGRTRAQRYSRKADWAYIERCARVASKKGDGLPLIGNGDVFGYADYETHMRSGNLTTCMIGRGALVKPWVLTEIKEKRVWDITSNERLAIFEQFAKDGLDHWGSDEKASISQSPHSAD